MLKKDKKHEEAAGLIEEKNQLDQAIANLKIVETQREGELKKLAGTIGNLVHDSVPVSQTEDDNAELRVWHPDGPNAKPEHRKDILSHHEVMYRLEMVDQERGTKVAGHRGYFLTNEGLDLNQALISYGLDFLRSKQYKKIMTPFMMKRGLMAKTAQLSEFDEALYKVESVQAEPGKEADADDEEKYLIATSEQPLSGLHSDEWFDDPSNQLPLRCEPFYSPSQTRTGCGFADLLLTPPSLQLCVLADMLATRHASAKKRARTAETPGACSECTNSKRSSR